MTGLVEPAPVWRYILLFTLLNGILALVTWGFEIISSFALPTGTSLAVHVIATIYAAIMFARDEGRMMLVGERVVIALAITVISLATLAAQIIGAVALEGIVPSLSGIAYALGIDQLDPLLVTAVAGMAGLVLFVFTFLLAGITARLALR